MTPVARLSAAIHCLDAILAGTSPETALTAWGRASRYAGSGDRNAVRDLVFDALRCKRSFAALGGAQTGRGLILGSLRDACSDPETLFTGQHHAPALLGPGDTAQTPQGMAALDCPDWLAPRLQSALGAQFSAVMMALQRRAPVFLRVNLLKANVAQAQTSLRSEGIETKTHYLSKTALEVIENKRKIQSSQAFQAGLVDLQDASSQAVIDQIALKDGMRVLDYCAGGGGKTLAMAAAAKISLFAQDADPRRMRDLPARAARAGAKVTITNNSANSAPYDVILIDVPCSGSGSWRRDPQGKWALIPTKLDSLCAMQAQILDDASRMVARKGVLAYATCSLLQEENMQQIQRFLHRTSGWALQTHRSFTPLDGGDGFFVALLARKD